MALRDEETSKNLTEVFREALKNEKLEVKVENLKNEKVAAMMTLSEESRRMQDMMKMYNMYGMDPSMFGGQETLVLNAKASAGSVCCRKQGFREDSCYLRRAV